MRTGLEGKVTVDDLPRMPSRAEAWRTRKALPEPQGAA